jgi:hypothetical protein
MNVLTAKVDAEPKNKTKTVPNPFHIDSSSDDPQISPNASTMPMTMHTMQIVKQILLSILRPISSSSAHDAQRRGSRNFAFFIRSTLSLAGAPRIIDSFGVCIDSFDVLREGHACIIGALERLFTTDFRRGADGRNLRSRMLFVGATLKYRSLPPADAAGFVAARRILPGLTGGFSRTRCSSPP